MAKTYLIPDMTEQLGRKFAPRFWVQEGKNFRVAVAEDCKVAGGGKEGKYKEYDEFRRRHSHWGHGGEFYACTPCQEKYEKTSKFPLVGGGPYYDYFLCGKCFLVHYH